MKEKIKTFTMLMKDKKLRNKFLFDVYYNLSILEMLSAVGYKLYTNPVCSKYFTIISNYTI